MRPTRLNWTSEHIVDLVDALTSLDVEEREAAIADLCNAFEPLVQTQALTYWRAIGHEGDLADVEQTARMAVIEACRTFTRGEVQSQVARFKAHVHWQLRRVFSDFVDHNHTRLLRLPHSMVQLRPRLEKMRQRLAQRLKRRPTTEELAEALGMTVEVVERVRVHGTVIYTEDEPMALDSPEDWLLVKELLFNGGLDE